MADSLPRLPGDIVIPGIFLALVLRMDVARAAAAASSGAPPPAARYFRSVMVGYVAGLGSTIAVMNLFSAAQPALLYIVPAVLGALALHAWRADELAAVSAWAEEAEERAGDEGAEGWVKLNAAAKKDT